MLRPTSTAQSGEKMSRYTELAKKATDWSKRFHVLLDQCKAFAFWMTGDYAVYIDAPRGELSYVQLDNDLRGTNRVEPSTVHPPMTLGKDGFWYFALSVRFAVDGSRYFMTESAAVGLHKGDDHWIARWNDTDYKVPLDDLSQVRRLFDDWIAMSNDMYDGPVTRKANGIGFVPSA
jgi:hypothetical protein